MWRINSWPFLCLVQMCCVLHVVAHLFVLMKVLLQKKAVSACTAALCRCSSSVIPAPFIGCSSLTNQRQVPLLQSSSSSICSAVSTTHFNSFSRLCLVRDRGSRGVPQRFHCLT